MTNRDMVRRAGAVPAVEPNTKPLPPMPAPEDGATPTTREDPIDSPQPNADGRRDATRAGKSGRATRR